MHAFPQTITFPSASATNFSAPAPSADTGALGISDVSANGNAPWMKFSLQQPQSQAQQPTFALFQQLQQQQQAQQQEEARQQAQAQAQRTEVQGESQQGQMEALMRFLQQQQNNNTRQR